MGLHREQSRGKLPRDPLVLILGAHFHCSVFPSMSYRCGSCRNSSKRPFVFARVFFLRCLMELSSSFLWPPWWPPQLPMAPVVPGTPSASSSHCASGGSRGSLTVRLGEAGVWCPLHPVLYCQVTEIDTAVCSLWYPLHSILKSFVLLFLFIHYFPADTVVNDLWFEAYSAAATRRLFYHIDTDRPLEIWGNFFFLLLFIFFF